MPETKIYCCGCGDVVAAILTCGASIYPRIAELHDVPFWQCPTCNNYVGCHHKTKKHKFKPLGCIPTPEIRNARKHIHKVLDPIWQTGKVSRGDLYAEISSALKCDFHTAKIRSIVEARNAYRAVLKLREKYI